MGAELLGGRCRLGLGVLGLGFQLFVSILDPVFVSNIVEPWLRLVWNISLTNQGLFGISFQQMKFRFLYLFCYGGEVGWVRQSSGCGGVGLRPLCLGDVFWCCSSGFDACQFLPTDFS